MTSFLLFAPPGAQNTLIGGKGNDYYIIHAGDTIIEKTNEGTDSVEVYFNNYTLATHVENLALTGDALIGSGNNLNNKIMGNINTNTLYGFGGDDMIYGGDDSAADILIGGLGNDTYVIQDVRDIISEIGNGGIDTIKIIKNFNNHLDYPNSGITVYTLNNTIENLLLANDAHNIVDGNELNNTLIGSSQLDELRGGAGFDYLDGGDGADILKDLSTDVNSGTPTTPGTNTPTYNILKGGAGNDLITGHGWLEGGLGDDTIYGGYNTLTGQETAGRPSSAADIYHYNLGDGNDTIYEFGDDSIIDILSFGAGITSDHITYATEGMDFIFQIQNSGIITVKNALDGTRNHYIEQVKFSGQNTYLDISQLKFSNLGTGGDDTLYGFINADTFIGSAGNDTYFIDKKDILIGSDDGSDTIAANFTVSLTDPKYSTIENLTLDGNDKINGTGNSGANILTGNSEKNTLTGGDGNDTYIIDSTVDVIIEGSSDNSGTEDAIQLAPTFTLDAGGSTSSYSLTLVNNIENLTGNSGNNILTGNSAKNTLTGGDGNDTYYIDSQDVVVESNIVNSGNDTIVVVNFSANLSNYSNIENILLIGSSEINATGNSGNNILTGNSAKNTLTGGDGNDTYIIDSAVDVVSENSSANSGTADTIQLAPTFTLETNGLTSSYSLTSVNNIENLTGNSDANVLTGNSAINTLTGGDGNDTYYIDNQDVVVESNIVNSGNDTIVVDFSANLSNYLNVENIILIGSSEINATGNSGNNILTGNSAKNTLTGGDGNDTYYIDSQDVAVESNTVNSGNDTIVVSFSANLSNYSNIEKVILTGSSVINATGNSSANILTGNSAINTLTGDDGNDTYYIDSQDAVIESNTANSGNDTIAVDFNANLSNYSNIENITLTGTATQATGNDSNNILTDNPNAASTLTGGYGSDTYIVSRLDNIIKESFNRSEWNVVKSSVNFDLSTMNKYNGNNTYINEITLTGSDNINATSNVAYTKKLTGNAGNNTLTLYGSFNDGTQYTLSGGDGNDVINGNLGNDLIYGGTGNDILSGSAYNDSYYFHLGDGKDTIIDAGDQVSYNHLYLNYSSGDTLGINANQLWLTRSGNNLELSVIDHPDEGITLTGWYAKSISYPKQQQQYGISSIHSHDGKTLTYDRVQALVDSMASYTSSHDGAIASSNSLSSLTAFTTSWI